MSKIRNSQQRNLIASLMKDNYKHPTADEVYEMAREKDPHISRGTVYRNLNMLAEMGEINKLTMPKGPDHFDCEGKNHYHFLCRCCYKVFDTPLKYNETLNHTPDAMAGFETEWHRLLLVGRCPECAKKDTDH